MHTEGTFEPASWADAHDRYEALGGTARTVVKEVAKAMDFDRDEYDERVTSEVVETARQVLFAESLVVRVGDEDAFADWRDAYPHEVTVAGGDDVDRVAWHAAPFTGTAVAATFQNEPAAAVGTVRRMAFNRIYREELP